MASLGKNLRQTLKKLACKTPVEQLVKRGVKEVKVVGLDHIVSLIEEAVHRSMRNKLMGMERAQLAGETREEFLRLLENHQSLQRSHDEVVREKELAEEELDQMRRQLNSQNQLLQEKLAHAELDLRAQYEGENNEIVERVNEVFRQLSTDPDAEIHGLRNRMLELVMHLVGEERKSAMAARQSAHDKEVEVLERRIDKLRGNLEATERSLAGLSNGEQVDPGISSIYREVQGLNRQDDQFERKQDLMADIFRANVALQKGTTDI